MINITSTNGIIEILIPDTAESAYSTAAEILQSEFHLRIDCPCDIIQSDSSSRGNDKTLQIQIETLDTLSEEIQSNIEQPIKLLPYPDYAEHVNLRTLQDNGIFKFLIICGSQKSLISGVGMLLRYLQFGDNCLHLNPINQDFKPLNPLRGGFYSKIKHNQPNNHDHNEFSELITNHSLWGNNTYGFNADCLTQIDIKLIKKHQQSLFVKVDPKTDYSYTENPDYVYFAPLQTGAESPQIFINSYKIFLESMKNRTHQSETWLGIDGFNEDELDEIFNELADSNNLNPKTIVYGPHNGHFEMIKREMPLTMQLISMNLLSQKDCFSLNALSQRFFEYAPLTYGAFNYSTFPFDEIARFMWSLLSWSPQPTVDQILELYGAWFFGFPAAPIIKDAILALEQDKSNTLDLLKKAETLIPERLKNIALPRLNKIRSEL